MVNYKFIAELEGNELIGYVPDPENSNSGVTIASGFDIGQRDYKELRGIFNPVLAIKLSPYCNIKGDLAECLLIMDPLTITKEEAKEINAITRIKTYCKLRYSWADSKAYLTFIKLNEQQQTVIASVSYQYGDLSKRTPNFWRQVTTGDWDAALKNLRDFGDKYPTRRNKEADYLEGKA